MSRGETLDGWLCVDKPAGITSHDVVAALRKILKTRKIGHTGTLDPMATGLLVLGLGEATRFIRYLPDKPKIYEGAIRFGVATDSWDITGEPVYSDDCQVALKPGAAVLPSPQQVQDALGRLQGRRMQKVPPVSAVRVNGERLWKKALRGEKVALPTREVEIYDIRVCGFDDDSECDELLACQCEAYESGSVRAVRIMTQCSRGTYIRSLAVELGELLQCPATLSALRRIETDGFSLKNRKVASAGVAFGVSGEIKPAYSKELHNRIIPVTEGLSLPITELDGRDARSFVDGRGIPISGRFSGKQGHMSALVFQDIFLGLARIEGDMLVPTRVSARGRLGIQGRLG